MTCSCRACVCGNVGTCGRKAEATLDANPHFLPCLRKACFRVDIIPSPTAYARLPGTLVSASHLPAGAEITGTHAHLRWTQAWCLCSEHFILGTISPAANNVSFESLSREACTHPCTHCYPSCTWLPCLSLPAVAVPCPQKHRAEHHLCS